MGQPICLFSQKKVGFHSSVAQAELRLVQPMKTGDRRLKNGALAKYRTQDLQLNIRWYFHFSYKLLEHAHFLKHPNKIRKTKKN